MKYLKLFEGFNSEDIDSICRKYKIENYTINEDGSIDVNGNIELSSRISIAAIKKLPLKFRSVIGYFNCNSNQLTSLEGSPKEVDSFFCSNNQLRTLKGGPETIGEYFSCKSNHLNSLEGSPKTVGGDFSCNNNQLKSLEGSPQSVGGDFNCTNNQLTSLKGCPKSVGGGFYCSNNKLKTLEGIGIISGDIYCDSNPCHSIYRDWINTDRRDELLDLMEDYDFLRGEEIYWERLEAFYKDSGLEIPIRKYLEKYYTIID